MSNDIETELLNAINEGNYNKVNSMVSWMDGEPIVLPKVDAASSQNYYPLPSCR